MTATLSQPGEGLAGWLLSREGDDRARAETWGPDHWPAAVRENVTEWPPRFRERQLIGAIRAASAQPQTIAVVSRKNGVGKSTTATVLQRIFASHRNPGTLLLDTASAPHPAQPLDWLRARHGVVVIDVNPEITDSAHRQLLDRTDQIVVVATPAVDGLYSASSYLDWLGTEGYLDLAANAVVALNRIRRMPFTDLLNIDRHFARRCRQVIRIPWDSRLAAAPLNLDEIRPTARTAFFELAAALAGQAEVSSVAVAQGS